MNDWKQFVNSGGDIMPGGMLVEGNGVWEPREKAIHTDGDSYDGTWTNTWYEYIGYAVNKVMFKSRVKSDLSKFSHNDTVVIIMEDGWGVRFTTTAIMKIQDNDAITNMIYGEDHHNSTYPSLHDFKTKTDWFK